MNTIKLVILDKAGYEIYSNDHFENIRQAKEQFKSFKNKTLREWLNFFYAGNDGKEALNQHRQ